MEKSHNRNYQRIDNAIVNAYKELLKEKGSPDSSITELCRLAKVNRTTFYKHYQGIYEITDRLEDELIYHLFDVSDTSASKIEDFLNNPKPALERLNNNLLSNLEYYRRVFRPERVRYIIDKTTNILFNEFKKQYPKLNKKPEIILKAKINITNFVGSITNLYIQWLNGYLDCDISKISDYMCEVLTHVYKNRKTI